MVTSATHRGAAKADIKKAGIKAGGVLRQYRRARITVVTRAAGRETGR
jgi:hypothetical protein